MSGIVNRTDLIYLRNLLRQHSILKTTKAPPEISGAFAQRGPGWGAKVCPCSATVSGSDARRKTEALQGWHKYQERVCGQECCYSEEQCRPQEDELATPYPRPALEGIWDVVELGDGWKHSGGAQHYSQQKQHESGHRSVHGSARLSDCRSTKGTPLAADYTPLFRLWIILKLFY